MLRSAVVCLIASCALSLSATEVRTVLNIVNFVRGCEPRNPTLDLVRPVAEEIALNTKYHLPNTILLQYDAMIRPDLMKTVRSAEANRTENGGVVSVTFTPERIIVRGCSGFTPGIENGVETLTFGNFKYRIGFRHLDDAVEIDLSL